jgi:serine/threonine protein kinase
MSAPAPHFTRFGRYEILRKLGRSMSDVYLAFDPATHRQIVLKIVEQCHDAVTAAIADAERRGASIQQRLHQRDPRILEIYDAGEHNGSFFVAMQYADGRTLAELLRDEGRLKPERAARYAAEICSQLATLHSFEMEIDGRNRAVVHGDIKPANIQIGPEDDLRLLDFGIAKAISATRRLTHHDLGSPAYCSPERLNHSQVDPQSDLWALGVCLYEMVAGLPPWQAQTTRKLENVIQSRRPPRALPPDCPSPLRAIIQKALAADAARRYDTAADLERDLRRFLDKVPTEAEADQTHRWTMNATVERPHTSRALEARSRIRSERSAMHWIANQLTKAVALFRSARGPLAAGMLAGVFVFVPAFEATSFWQANASLWQGRDYTQATLAQIDGDFQRYTQTEREYRWLRGLSPARPLRERLVTRLLAAANQRFQLYRNHAHLELASLDWTVPVRCLQYASRLAPGNVEVLGRLALAEGYLAMTQKPEDPETARGKFQQAAQRLPDLPDPHLALARFYVYEDGNLGRAMAEWSSAERLGFRLGPREWEQEGDAYTARVENTFRKLNRRSSASTVAPALLLLRRDMQRARARYEPIDGYGNVSRSLEKLNRIELAAAALEAKRQRRPIRISRARRWP